MNVAGTITDYNLEQLQGIVAHTLEHQGGTWHRSGEPYTGLGYTVGGVGDSLSVPIEEFTVNDLRSIAREMQQREGVMLGTWVYKGEVHIETVCIIFSYGDAMFLTPDPVARLSHEV